MFWEQISLICILSLFSHFGENAWEINWPNWPNWPVVSELVLFLTFIYWYTLRALDHKVFVIKYFLENIFSSLFRLCLLVEGISSHYIPLLRKLTLLYGVPSEFYLPTPKKYAELNYFKFLSYKCAIIQCYFIYLDVLRSSIDIPHNCVYGSHFFWVPFSF